MKLMICVFDNGVWDMTWAHKVNVVGFWILRSTHICDGPVKLMMVCLQSGVGCGCTRSPTQLCKTWAHEVQDPIVGNGVGDANSHLQGEASDGEQVREDGFYRYVPAKFIKTNISWER